MRRILELLLLARGRTDERLAGVDEAALARPSLWGSATVDVRERLHQIGVHLVEVIVQAEKMLGVGDTEARRIIRRIAAVRGLHEARTAAPTLMRLDERLARLAAQCSAR